MKRSRVFRPRRWIKTHLKNPASQLYFHGKGKIRETIWYGEGHILKHTSVI
ncbi:Uncharacterized protein dnm_040440 [Desulfonema magnum]|uniref:Uncharacterized protein n=1 Tax=Desulfonema magnum TaxID=45655 RepID=A0A975GNP9_9BACT|nr:Uncharacterized protein dnm_040440 [Desulfonema magnum]